MGRGRQKAKQTKVARRLIPVLFFCYILAYLDRVNISFAKLQMLDDLKRSGLKIERS